MIELDRDGSVFVLRMRGGENRFSLEWLGEVNAALDRVQAADGPVALVTTGEGKFYSNGMDLDWLATVPDQAGGLPDRDLPTARAGAELPRDHCRGGQRARVRRLARSLPSRTTSRSCAQTAGTGACPRPISGCR